jgi:hypothetical protein
VGEAEAVYVVLEVGVVFHGCWFIYFGGGGARVGQQPTAKTRLASIESHS